MVAESVFIANISGFKTNCVCLGSSADTNTPYIADVVLPKNNRGKILAGEEAEASRVASGYPWPEESRINKNRLRRIPVPLLWKILLVMQRQDKTQLDWHIADSISFSFSRMLATYINSILPKGYFDNTIKRLFLPIPDAMNEYSQDNLIRELKILGIESYHNRTVEFVWRPIAIALAWLDKIKSSIINSYKINDFIVVCHIGVDAIEIVDFSLKRKGNFIVPKRRTTGNTLSVAGIDWVADYISEIQGLHNFYAFWQYFTNIPEIWNLFAGIRNTEDDFPCVLYDGINWRNFSQTNMSEQTALNMECKQNKIIREISPNVEYAMEETNSSWGNFIIEKIINTIIMKKDKRLRGVIVSGDIFSYSTSQLMKNLLARLTEVSNIKCISEEPQENTLWCPNPLRDVVVEGVAVYADRIISQLPTYIDVLKGLHMLVDTQTKYDWHKLVEDDYEIDGGQKKDDIRSGYIFSLKPNTDHLSIYFKRGLDDIKKQEVFFPESPKKEMTVEAQVSIASAHGLARVEMVPKDTAFLGDQKVFLDYSMMRSINPKDLPQKKLGSPGVDDDFHLSNNDELLFTSRITIAINDFMWSEVSEELESYYRSYVDELKRKFCYFSTRKGKKIRLLNRSGSALTAKGDKLLEKIKYKITRDFEYLLNNISLFDRNKKIQSLVGLSSWMFGGCVDIVRGFIREEIVKKNKVIGVNILIRAAGRSFYHDTDIKLLYKLIFDLVDSREQENKSTVFPNYFMLALCDILSFRKNSPGCMNLCQVKKFMNHTALRIIENANNKYSTVFVQAVNTALYLLRYREVDPTFFNEDDPLKEKVKQAINNAKRIRCFSARLKGICDCMDKVIDCQATKDDIIMLKHNIDKESMSG